MKIQIPLNLTVGITIGIIFYMLMTYYISPDLFTPELSRKVVALDRIFHVCFGIWSLYIFNKYLSKDKNNVKEDKDENN